MPSKGFLIPIYLKSLVDIAGIVGMPAYQLKSKGVSLCRMMEYPTYSDVI